MASARGNRLSGLLAFIGVAALGVTYAVITGWNPLPRTVDWLARAGSLASPAPAWKIRAPEQPRVAVVTGRAVILVMPGSVQARDRRNGDVLWTRDAAWGAVAGDPAAGTLLAVVGRPSRHGFDVMEPASGGIRWTDRDATGVWTYRDLVVTLACTSTQGCALAGHDPRYGTVRWRSGLPGMSHGPTGANPRLAAVRPLSAAALDDASVAPRAAPAAIGVPEDGGVAVVSTADGRRLGTYRSGPDGRVVVAGGRVVTFSGARRGNGCRYTITGRDPSGGRQVWRLDGYDPQVGDPLGCDADHDPVGAAGLLVAIGPTGLDVLIDAGTGAVRLTAGTDERVVATDGTVALLRTADKRAIRAVTVGGGQLWREPVPRHATVSLGGYGVLVCDPGGGRSRLLDARSGRELLNLATGAAVLGATPETLVLALGRTIGPVPVT